jgi:hypothetical protein
MAKAFDIKQLDKTAQRVFHAGVGVTDLAVEVVRDYAAEAQKRAQERLAALQQSVITFDPKTLRDQAAQDAKARRTAVEKRVAELRSEAGAVPSRVQQAIDTNVSTATKTATETYGDLVKRGEVLVGRIRRQQSTQEVVAAAETTVAKARTTRTQATAARKTTAKKTAAKKATAAKSSAKATRTSAKKTVSAGSRALADLRRGVGD